MDKKTERTDKNEERDQRDHHEEKIRRKDSKMTENILKTVANLDPEEKFQTLVAKYKDLYEEYRRSQSALTALRKKNAALQQENECVTNENDKLHLARNRLEKLSREFQRQNKILQEENFIKIKEEEERRRQITVEFQKALGNVTAMMAESNEQNTKLGEENKTMAKRLSTIYEDFKNRQSEVDRFSKQIDLERQLYETRISKLNAEFTVEKEKLSTERDLLRQRCEYLTAELKASSEKSASLERTVGEFQKTVDRSSDVFDHCKLEIANMNEHIFNQKKELQEWQSKNQKNLTTIRELTILNDQKCKLIDQVTKKQSQLTKLCRQLQAERAAYINALRSNGHDPDDFIVDVPLEEREENVKQTSPSKKSASENAQQQKGKRNRSKNKKTSDAENVAEPDGLTIKEIKLAELKEELKRVQDHVAKIQSGQIEPQMLDADDVLPKRNLTKDENVFDDSLIDHADEPDGISKEDATN